MTTVVIVDDHDMVAVGLSSLLEEITDIAVVGRARSVAEASAVVARHRPDVVLMDYRLPDGTERTPPARSERSRIRRLS